MSLTIDVLSVSIHHPDYWTLWVGRIDDGSPNDNPSLLKIGTRGRKTDRDNWRLVIAGIRVTFDILWLSWVIRKHRTWVYHRERNRQLERATFVEPECLCGHTVYSHCPPDAYFIGPCDTCECEEYRPAEFPPCTCGHRAVEHAMIGPNLFLACLEDDCECDKYDPEDLSASIDRLVHGIIELIMEDDPDEG